MAYTPHEWECGETITAELLNNIEGGVQESLGNAPLVLTVDVQEVPCPDDPSKIATQFTYNHSWQEIHDALAQGRLVVLVHSAEEYAEMMLIAEAYTDTDVEPARYIVATASSPQDEFNFTDANGLVHIGLCSNK